jgi:lysophospholipase L1-like esterase
MPPTVVNGPAAIPSCNFWVRAEDAAAFTPDGSTTAFLPDRMGTAPLTQPTANRRPRVCLHGFAGAGGPDAKPFLAFDTPGTAHVLTHASYLVNKRAVSGFWVGDLLALQRNCYLINFGSLSVVLMHNNGVIKVFSTATKSTTLRLPSNRRVAVVVTCGEGAVKVYVDRVDYTQTLAVNPAGTGVGIALSDTGGGFYGRAYEAAAYPRELNPSEVDALLQYARATYQTGSVAEAATGAVAFTGDSITEGALGSSRLMNWPTRLAVNPAWRAYNHSISGLTLTQMAAFQADVNVWAASGNWLFVWGGNNDIAAGDSGVTIEGRLNTYCTAAIVAGFPKAQIVVFTLATTNTGAGGTGRDDTNTLIRANYTGYAGWLVDVAADTELGVVIGGGFFDSTNYVDGVHPNDKGVEKLVKLIRATVTLPF